MPKRAEDDSPVRPTGERRRRWIVTCCLAVMVTAGWPVPGRSQTIDSGLWGADNRVFALARVGDTLYVAGAFRGVGQSSGGAVELPKHCADQRKPFPKVAGYVYTIAPDGHGGWFLAGDFTAVGGVSRYSLAHVLADGSIAAWDPNPNRQAAALLVCGDTVYVSGLFATISGKIRLYIAALDATTGEALDWDAHADGIATPLAVRGNLLYVGGSYSNIGGQPRNNVAALDVTTGVATPWNPNADGGVWSILVRDTSLHVGGSFSQIGGQSRSLIAELDRETGLATSWNPGVDRTSQFPAVVSILSLGDTLYVGGYFSSIGDKERHGLASFDLRGGGLTDWDPSASAASGPAEIDVLRSDGRSIYVGGWFQSIGGQPRKFVAELDASTGAATSWNPDPSSVVYALAAGESTICIGGTFRSLGMVPRHNLAAFDLKTGAVTDWNPNPDGLIVYALAAHHDKIYAGGDFSQIGGQFRSDLAALDPRTGLATDWNPGADQVVMALVVQDSTVYAGGAFARIGGQPKRFLAALDAKTGAAREWNPDPSDFVSALAMCGDTLFAGGWFREMGGRFHGALAAVNATSGNVLPWQIDVDGTVSALAVGDGSVYAGGEFESVLGGPPRLNLLSFDARNGELRDWAPSPNGPREDYYTASVDALSTRGGAVFVGGDFTTIAGHPRSSLAALDGETGALLDWDPSPDQSVHALEASGDRLYAGGYFQAAGRLPHLALMGVSLPDLVTPPRFPVPQAVVLAPIRPNPIQSTATIGYILPSATSVNLAVYDLQGRLVENLLEHQVQAAGEHRVSMNAERLSTGCYFYRLEAAGVVCTQKAVVLR